ncbi:MAG TPA: WYL domain-containing protein, partial [Gemmatimonadales bacterium]|nr:WYL domain-containing protein [Gemmatimonadales bacterium]
MSASETLARIVAITAELTLRDSNDAPEITIEELARSHGVTPGQIERDIQTLTLLGDSADSDWLLSLRIVQEANRISIASSGPFQRPVRLTPEEMLAMQMALVAEGHVELAAKLGGEADASAPVRPQLSPTIPDLVSDAITGQRRLRCRYASDRRDEPSVRIIQPHQAVEYRSRVYIVAWCEKSNAWRRFRLDRILEAEHDGTFQPRQDFVPLRSTDEVFQAGKVEEVL